MTDPTPQEDPAVTNQVARHSNDAHGSHGTAVVSHGAADTPENFENPGLPPHIHRHGDHDEKAAKRSELQVVTMFGLSMLFTLLFIVSYFAIGQDATVTLPLSGKVGASHTALGVTLGLSILFIGLGAIHWAKTLMSDEEVVEERHPLRSDDETRDSVVKTLADAGESTHLTRRPLLKMTMGGALGLFALPLGLQLLGSMGPMPRNDLEVTLWGKKLNGKNRRLMRDPDGTAIRLSDVTLGSVFHVLPEGVNETEHPLNEKAKSSVILVSLDENKIKSQKQRDWGIGGVVAYSKICTHVGCPVGLYEQQTHHLLCPCHQSTFDMTEDCKVIFGPAKRPLPQLKISVDDEGYLVADGDFADAVGPSFWELA